MSTPNEEIERIIKEYERRFMNNGVNGILDDIFQDPRTVLTRAFIREALTTFATAVREEERVRIETELGKHIAPHPLSLVDSVWLKRLLNKVFGHEN